MYRLKEVFHWASVRFLAEIEGKKSENHLHIFQPARFESIERYAKQGVVELSHNADKRAVIKGDSYLLWLQIRSAGVQSLKDDIDTALILSRMILSYYGCVNDAVVQTTTIFDVKVFVTLVGKSFLDMSKAIFFTTTVRLMSDTKFIGYSSVTVCGTSAV